MEEGYDVPAGGLEVAIPRTTTRILFQTFLVHLFADFAYTHLCELVPRFRNNSFGERCVQVLIFWHLPAYILMQQFTTLFAAAVEEIEIPRPSTAACIGDLAGVRRYKSRSYRESVQALSWLRLPFLLVAVAGCWLGAAAYVERYGIRYHQMKDVGNLGIDHRNGWVSFSGLTAGTFALGIRVYLWYQSRLPSTDAERLASHEDDKQEEEEEALDAETCEMPLIKMNLGHGLTLVEAFWATVIQQIPLLVTHRAISIASFLPATLILVAVLTGVALKKSRPTIARRAGSLLKWVMTVVVVWTIVEPSLRDISELYAASETILHQWSFRWQATDRFDRILRAIV